MTLRPYVFRIILKPTHNVKGLTGNVHKPMFTRYYENDPSEQELKDEVVKFINANVNLTFGYSWDVSPHKGRFQKAIKLGKI